MSVVTSPNGDYTLIAECPDERTEMMFLNSQAIGFPVGAMQEIFRNLGWRVWT